MNFQLGYATKLDGLNRFDTVVDSAFYHTFRTEPELQRSYARALHRATKPGARLYMFGASAVSMASRCHDRCPRTTFVRYSRRRVGR